MSPEYIIIFLTLIFSAFFSGMEIAFVSSNKLKIFLDKDQGNLSNNIVSRFTDNPNKFIISMLVGNNIALVIYGIYISNLLDPFIVKNIVSIPFFVLLIQVLISSFLVLLFAEFLPKVIFSIFPNRLLKIFAIPAVMLISLLYPFSLFMNTIANFLILLFGKHAIPSPNVFNRIDLDEYLEEHNTWAKKSLEGVDPEVEILQNALDFSNIKVRDCMIPRTDIVCVSIDDSISDLRKKFIETGHSKILVYKENLDNVIAYVHSYELFKNPSIIKDILLPISVIPESILVQSALDKLLKERRSVALVVDEYGGTSGLICVEDILEELVGEIEDEHDEKSFLGRQIDENKYFFLGKSKIEQLNELYNLDFELSEDYDTLNGYIINQIDRIPKNKEIIRFKNYEFKVIKIVDNFIEEVILNVSLEK